MVKKSISRRLVWLRNRRPTLHGLKTLCYPRLSNLYFLISLFALVMVLFCMIDHLKTKSSSPSLSNVSTFGFFSIFGTRLKWPPSSGGQQSGMRQEPVYYKPWGDFPGSCRAIDGSTSSNKKWPRQTSKEESDLRRKNLRKSISDKYHNRIDPKVLVFVETQYSPLGKQIVEVLEASRIRFKLEMAGKSLPILTNQDKGKFAVIIFENLNRYIHMNKWNRELIDKYCREYSVGIVGFLLAKSDGHKDIKVSSHENGENQESGHFNEHQDAEDFDYDNDGHSHGGQNEGRTESDRKPIQVPGFPLTMIQAKDLYQEQLKNLVTKGMKVKNESGIIQSYHIDSSSAILRVAKAGIVHSSKIDEPELIPGSENWILFQSNHSAYHPVTYLYTIKDTSGQSFPESGFKHFEPKSGLKSDLSINIFNEHESMIKASSDTYQDNQEMIPLKNMRYENNEISKNMRYENNEILQQNIYNDKRFVMNIVHDDGSYDNIEKIIFGSSLSDFWMHKIVLLDSISFLSHNKLSLPLNHFLLIDIDDIFVGETGTRMRKDDVDELLNAQSRLEKLVPGFKFNLGFSGKFYHRGNDAEDEGDDELIAKANNFWWFCHMWSHSQPHLYNSTMLENEMRLNLDFAHAHKLPYGPFSGYSIAPHHSGVYPVHEPLYETWKRVLNVRVTSTEEYPHLRPARLRRGFIYQGIAVLPRQTCGLYTHTHFLDKYPGGSNKLIQSIKGGELFYTLVYNPINIFMTHLSNYGNDRLALLTFESVINYVQCWTNIKLSTLPPVALAKKYFQSHPEETDPLWINPCLDKRHAQIWSVNKSCDQLPRFLVIGPQKTGTTALYTFLLMHPTISSSHPSPETFEEVQFFNGKNYYKGLDWYMNFFPDPNSIKNDLNGSSTGHGSSSGIVSKYLFEKSATYFDGELVPLRVHSLLPSAKIITILINPIKRAYSWYQHVRAHRDVTALNYSFYEVVTANERSPRALRDLRNRCLIPGLYNQHLEHWFTYFPPAQVMIIDGEELAADPASVMARLQSFLKIEPFFDYSSHLRYDPKKGFFCQLTTGNGTKCLGRSKGRNYEPMDQESEKFLRNYFMPHNVALSKLLSRIHSLIPPWLEEELSRV